MCLLPPTHNPRPDPHMQYEYVIASLSIARAFFGFFRLLTSKALFKAHKLSLSLANTERYAPAKA